MTQPRPPPRCPRCGGWCYWEGDEDLGVRRNAGAWKCVACGREHGRSPPAPPPLRLIPERRKRRAPIPHGELL